MGGFKDAETISSHCVSLIAARHVTPVSQWSSLCDLQALLEEHLITPIFSFQTQQESSNYTLLFCGVSTIVCSIHNDCGAICCSAFISCGIKHIDLVVVTLCERLKQSRVFLMGERPQHSQICTLRVNCLMAGALAHIFRIMNLSSSLKFSVTGLHVTSQFVRDWEKCLPNRPTLFQISHKSVLESRLFW